ncbi:hypothetical protein TREES_T100004251 [Tupaia chinensis]|uniref:Uncharacterized protein n=1 Tax=Tupaia chinensis TaxID=246437 RepID=L9KH55_TUPCH|nr:hypothetical protein TREES_T100004251 [Tupaia chinensis]
MRPVAHGSAVLSSASSPGGIIRAQAADGGFDGDGAIHGAPPRGPSTAPLHNSHPQRPSTAPLHDSHPQHPLCPNDPEQLSRPPCRGEGHPSCKAGRHLCQSRPAADSAAASRTADRQDLLEGSVKSGDIGDKDSAHGLNSGWRRPGPSAAVFAQSPQTFSTSDLQIENH